MLADTTSAGVATLSAFSAWLPPTGGPLSDANDCCRGGRGRAGAPDGSRVDSPTPRVLRDELSLNGAKFKQTTG